MNVRKGRVFVLVALGLTALFVLGWVLGVAGEGAPTGTLIASNSPPVAQDDAYTTTADVPLLVAAPGVLGNDSDPDGDPLTATLISPPAAGTLVLDHNGSFEYTPIPGPGGIYTFTYLAADGTPPVQAYWPFEEGSGDTTLNVIEDGPDGTLMNGVSFTTTIPSIPGLTNFYALSFERDDDYVDVLPIDVSENAYAVSLWINTLCDYCGIFSVDDGELGDHGHDRHLFLYGGNVCGRVWNGLYNQETICTSGSRYNDGTWHHLVHTFGGHIGGQRLYIDGQQRAKGSQAVSEFNWQTGINIGFSNDAPYGYLDGLIDDVRVYPMALTKDQVAAIMAGDQIALSDSATVTITVAAAPAAEALMALYENTGGENWINNDSWGDPTVSYCDWYGVTCDQGGEPVQLALSSNNLAGPLPAELAGLSGLTHLDLGSNPHLTCWKTEEAVGWALGLSWYSGPGAVCLYVDRDATGADTGDSWADAFTDLQSALAMPLTVEGVSAEIWVAEGVYTPTHQADEDPRSATFQLRSGAALYGGFAGTERYRQQRDWASHPTVLSGDLDGNDLTDPFGVVTATEEITGTNAWTVVTGDGVDATAVLDGFTITAGNANGGTDECSTNEPCQNGGGMYNATGRPSLVDVTFSGNAAGSYGGGVFNFHSNPSFVRTTFSGNSAKSGGGMCNSEDSNASLENVTFTDNSAVYDGGGMGNFDSSSPSLAQVTFSRNSAMFGGGMANTGDSSPSLVQVTFSDNFAHDGAGGMGNWLDSSPTLVDVAFLGNSAGTGGGMANGDRSDPSLVNVVFDGNSAEWGGGMYNTSGDIFSGWPSNPSLVNVTFNGNSAEHSGGAMANRESDPTLVNSILWGNSAGTGGDQIDNSDSTPAISYSDIQGSGGGGTEWDSSLGDDHGGNIDADPLFVGTAEGDLRLRYNSPGIDAGNNAALPGDIKTDLDGKPRFVDLPAVLDTGSGSPPIVDMGPYETQRIIFVDRDAAGANNGATWTDAFTELQPALSLALTLQRSCAGIWVAEGIYYPDYDPDLGAHTGSVTATFLLSDEVALYGGFDPGAGAVAWEQRDPAGYLTVLSGDLDRNDSADANGVVTHKSQIVGENAWSVVTVRGVDRTAVLDGFTVTSGNAVSGDADCVAFEPCRSGGGMFIDAGSPTLVGLTFSGNNAAWDGGGLFNVDRSSPKLVGVTFHGNSAQYGGGLYNMESHPELLSVIFDRNSATSQGGGMYSRSYSSPSLVDVAFNTNSAGSRGGGMYNGHSSPTLVDVIFGDNSAGYDGGGMFNSDSSPTLAEVTFDSNSAGYWGGGICSERSGLTLSDATFSGNSAGWGGAIFTDASHSELIRVAFDANTAEKSGGGMYNWTNSSAALVEVTFSDNWADYGGGLFEDGSTSELLNVVFEDNSASYGGGMFNWRNSNPSLVNVTFSGNSASAGGGGICNEEGHPSLFNVTFGHNEATLGAGMDSYLVSNPTLVNCILWGYGDGAAEEQISSEGGTTTISHSDIQGSGGSGTGWDTTLGIDGGGNLDADPLFVDAAGGDLRLRPGSPAIDAGDNSAVPPEVTTDLRGWPRIIGGTVDMGAYETRLPTLYLPLVMRAVP